LIKEGKKWQDRVPKYLISNIKDKISKTHRKDQIFKHVVLGGTFDKFHLGHKKLLEKAFEIGKKITIGIATKELYKDKFLSEIIEPFALRKKSVEKFVKNKATIISFSEFTGGSDKIKEFDAIIVSRETFVNALKINELRKMNHLEPLMIVIIEDVLAEDGKIISSERIRKGEINRNGLLYKLPTTDYKLQTSFKMPESLRPELQKPLGKIFKDEKLLLRCIDTSKHTLMIAVGDIIVDSLMKEGIDPDVKVIDHKSRREKTDLFAKLRNNQKGPTLINNPGTINFKTAEVIKAKIKSALYKKEKSWIVVDGEEDLLALPAILFAPLGSLVLYGHWEHGIISVEIDGKIKKKTQKLLNKFT